MSRVVVRQTDTEAMGIVHRPRSTHGGFDERVQSPVCSAQQGSGGTAILLRRCSALAQQKIAFLAGQFVTFQAVNFSLILEVHA